MTYIQLNDLLSSAINEIYSEHSLEQKENILEAHLSAIINGMRELDLLSRPRTTEYVNFQFISRYLYFLKKGAP